MYPEHRRKRQQLIAIRQAAADCLLYSGPLETKELPEDGKGDQYTCVNGDDRNQFLAAFLTNDGSAHYSSPSVQILFCWQAHRKLLVCCACSMPHTTIKWNK
jgi:hypothetical protein